MPRVFRALVACAVLTWLGAVAWPRQIDDQFITLAFARSAVETGLPRWSTGELVEACSSPLQLVLAAVAIAFDADANLFVKALAAAAGLGIVAFAAARLPRAAVGTLVVLALASWEPLGWWSFAGMESTLYAALLTLGWTGLFATPAGDPRRTRLLAPLGALWLAATAHPEGNLHFLLAAVWTLSRAPRDVLRLLLAWAAWHGLRFGLYGELLPTPYLVKIAANPGFGRQWIQVTGDLVTTVGVAVPLLLGFRLRARYLLPFLIQLLVALRAEPDWMGHARHLLPGVVATAVVWAANGTIRPARWRAALALPFVLLGAALEAPSLAHEAPALGRDGAGEGPWTWLALAFDTPQLEDVRWIVEEAPPNGTVMLEDVGMPGNVPGVGILDTVGLTDRTIALANAGVTWAEAAVTHRLRARPPSLVRRMRYGGEGVPHPLPWLRLPEPTLEHWPQGTAALYRLTEDRPDQATILDRWRLLHARYPTQGPLAWELATALADAGNLREAAQVAGRMKARFPRDPVMEALPSAVFAPFDIEVAGVRPVALRQLSRPLPRGELLGLVLLVEVEPPGAAVTVQWACGGAPTRVEAGETPIPPWVCPGEQARLQVQATDARPTAPLAERLAVGLVAR